MYIPKYYQLHDYEEIKQFMHNNNFVTVITTEGKKPIATHLPVNIEEHSNVLYISGHFAKGNKQWQTINNNDNILIIFHGPHAYVSSTWYEQEDVPTWDYESIHTYSEGQLLDEEQLAADLTKLLKQYEQHRENGATWDNLSDQTKKQIKGIVGFKIKVTGIEAAYKLSQTRSEQEKRNIALQLNNSDNPMDHTLADEIEKQ
jgi:transcriptional regulator